MILRYLAAWLLLAAVGIVNGMLRNSTYGRHIPDLAAHQVSTLTGILATGAVVWLLSRRWPFESAMQAWTIGIVWLLMTVAFEFGFGRFVVGHSWARLFADYNLLAGRVWVLFLIWITVLPRLCLQLDD